MFLTQSPLPCLERGLSSFPQPRKCFGPSFEAIFDPSGCCNLYVARGRGYPARGSRGRRGRILPGRAFSATMNTRGIPAYDVKALTRVAAGWSFLCSWEIPTASNRKFSAAWRKRLNLRPPAETLRRAAARRVSAARDIDWPRWEFQASTPQSEFLMAGNLGR